MKRISYILNNENEIELINNPRNNARFIIIDQHRINESEIARALGFTHQYIQKIIAGKVKAPRARGLIQLYLFPDSKNRIAVYSVYKHNKLSNKKILKNRE
jgi:predicted transcriptional regulator